MVKADLTRDYYGDLELPQNADINDIKRQFKKLGMISSLSYLPDKLTQFRSSAVPSRSQSWA
jgi:DnaJ-class molecular chaperone